MTMDCRTTLILSFVALSVGDKELRLLGLQAMTGEAWPGGWACLVPVQMAIDRINKDDRLLKGYNLTYDYIDHEVSDVFASLFLNKAVRKHRIRLWVISNRLHKLSPEWFPG